MIPRSFRTSALCLLVAAGGIHAAAQAQDKAPGWPAKPVRILVPFAAGGGVDSVARTLATYLSKDWGQVVYVENKPGAGGQISGQALATSSPDGYTLLLASQSLAASAALAKAPTYDPVKDIVGVAPVLDAPSLFVVNPQVPANSVADFIVLAKASPGKLNYGSTGIGSGPHLAMEQFKAITGTDIVHVPYNGEAPMYSGIFSNEVQVSILAPQSGLNLVRSGRLKALAVASQTRYSLLPNAPSMAESGVKGWEYKPWVGFFAPSKTPPDVIRKINAEVEKVMQDETIRDKYLPQWGSELLAGSADDFHARYLNDLETYRKVVRDSKVPLND